MIFATLRRGVRMKTRQLPDRELERDES
jgi:hypothetical protein